MAMSVENHWTPMSGKRGLDDFEASPAKRMKQFLQDGFMTNGPAWANAVVAQDAQIANMLDTIANTEAATIPEEKVNMEVEGRERDWWAWWNDRILSSRS
mmetsp:Transcript_6818/g.21324  ORF Transcript_6818/g.21324 Transcript_6818/m.21324 type:complete len:100 (+) Transcript_6818:790-1089(+)